MVLYFALMNSPTVAKIFSCKNLCLFCLKLTRDTALKPISLDLPENSTPIWYKNKFRLFSQILQYWDIEVYWNIFLVTHTWLYMRVCPSVSRSVRWSVGGSVGRSVGRSVGLPFFLTAEFKSKSDLTSINAPAQRAWLMLPSIRPCFKWHNLGLKFAKTIEI